MPPKKVYPDRQNPKESFSGCRREHRELEKIFKDPDTCFPTKNDLLAAIMEILLHSAFNNGDCVMTNIGKRCAFPFMRIFVDREDTRKLLEEIVGVPVNKDNAPTAMVAIKRVAEEKMIKLGILKGTVPLQGALDAYYKGPITAKKAQMLKEKMEKRAATDAAKGESKDLKGKGKERASVSKSKSEGKESKPKSDPGEGPSSSSNPKPGSAKSQDVRNDEEKLTTVVETAIPLSGPLSKEQLSQFRNAFTITPTSDFGMKGKPGSSRKR